MSKTGTKQSIDQHEPRTEEGSRDDIDIDDIDADDFANNASFSNHQEQHSSESVTEIEPWIDHRGEEEEKEKKEKQKQTQTQNHIGPRDTTSHTTLTHLPFLPLSVVFLVIPDNLHVYTYKIYVYVSVCVHSVILKVV